MKIYVLTIGFLLMVASQADAFCGLPVIYGPSPGGAHLKYDQFTGQPSIILDPEYERFVGSVHIRFVLEHECAHFQLGHIDIKLGTLLLDPLALPWVTYDHELQADCRAAELLAEVGDTLAIAAAIRYWARNPLAAGSPTAGERINVIRQCSGY